MMFSKTVYDKLVAKVNATETNGVDLRKYYDTNKIGIEKKIYESPKRMLDKKEND